MSTQTTTWGRSDIDGLVHAWTDKTWLGDAVAVCEHVCPPQHVDCAGQGIRCSACLDATMPRP